MGEEAWPDPGPPVGLKIEEATAYVESNAEFICHLRTPICPPGTYSYDSKRHDLIEGVSKCLIPRQEAQVKFNEYREAQCGGGGCWVGA